jgi:hypothetical protein
MVRKDHRFQWSREETYRSRLEFLIGLMAHEAHHATKGHPKHFLRNDRVNRAEMEFRCNEAAQRAVADFHDDWPRLLPAIRTAMRRDRNRNKDREAKLKQKRLDPDLKLAKAQAQLKRWQAKHKTATTKLKKYRRMVKYHEGRVAARESACS